LLPSPFSYPSHLALGSPVRVASCTDQLHPSLTFRHVLCNTVRTHSAAGGPRCTLVSRIRGYLIFRR